MIHFVTRIGPRVLCFVLIWLLVGCSSDVQQTPGANNSDSLTPAQTDTTSTAAAPDPTPYFLSEPAQIAFEMHTINYPGDSGSNGSIYILDAHTGAARNLTNNDSSIEGYPSLDEYPSWSPDRKQIAFESRRSTDSVRTQIFVVNADGTNLHQLTTSNDNNFSPAWSPDGRKIAFVSDRYGQWQIYLMNTDGSNQQLLTDLKADYWQPAWSPDSTKLTFVSNRGGNFPIVHVQEATPILTPTPSPTPSEGEPTKTRRTVNPDSDFAIYVMDTDGNNIHALTESTSDDFAPAWSPDGKQISFMSYRDRSWQIYIMDANGGNVRRLTAGQGGYSPAWSADGRRIVYVAPIATQQANQDTSSQASGLMIMNADGSDVHPLPINISASDSFIGKPAWAAGVTDSAVQTAPAVTPTLITATPTATQAVTQAQ